MSYTIEIKDVPISATGVYPQGALTREMFEELVQSYNPAIHKARVRVAHASEYQSRNIPEAPVFAYVDKLKVVDKGERAFLLADLKAHEAFNKYKTLYPEFSIELYERENANNPTVQPHINKPALYLKGVAMLGATPPAVKGLDSVALTQSDYSDYRFNVNEFSETIKKQMKMDAIQKLKDMLNATDEQEMVNKVEQLLAKSLDYEKMYSEAKATKTDLEKKVEVLERQFAEAQKQVARKEFEVKLIGYDDKVRAKALEAFDAHGKEFAEHLLNVIAVLPKPELKPELTKTVVMPRADSTTTTTTGLAFSDYGEWVKASISYDEEKKKKAYEFAEKHADLLKKWVEEKLNN